MAELAAALQAPRYHHAHLLQHDHKRPGDARTLVPCPACGAAPLVHVITETVYDADPLSGGEIVASPVLGQGGQPPVRRTFTAKDHGIILIECPYDCMGIEGTEYYNLLAEWNELELEDDGLPFPVSGEPYIRGDPDVDRVTDDMQELPF